MLFSFHFAFDCMKEEKEEALQQAKCTRCVLRECIPRKGGDAEVEPHAVELRRIIERDRVRVQPLFGVLDIENDFIWIESDLRGNTTDGLHSAHEFALRIDGISGLMRTINIDLDLERFVLYGETNVTGCMGDLPLQNDNENMIDEVAESVTLDIDDHRILWVRHAAAPSFYVRIDITNVVGMKW